MLLYKVPWGNCIDHVILRDYKTVEGIRKKGIRKWIHRYKVRLRYMLIYRYQKK